MRDLVVQVVDGISYPVYYSPCRIIFHISFYPEKQHIANGKTIGIPVL